MWIDYDEYMSSAEWFAKREQVIARCSGICEGCKAKKMQHVHHLTYERFGNELLEDLQGLCLECHQAEHPDKKLKRDWLLISEIAEKLNITMPSLKRVLKREGLVENIVISRGWKTEGGKTTTCKNTADVPTGKAYEKKMYKNKPGAKHKGQRGPYVWDFDLVKQVLEAHEVPQKGENKVELPSFMQKPTKTEEYNGIVGKYGLDTSYNKKSSHWEIKRGKEIMATFYPSKRYGGYATITGKVKSVEVKDGFDGVVRLLVEHGVIQEMVVA